MKIELSHSLNEIQSTLKHAQEKQLKTAHQRALKKTLTSVGVLAKETLKERYKLPPKVLKTRVKGKMNNDAKTGVLWIGLVAPISVKKLGAPQQTPQGARVAGKTYQGTFTAKMKNGHRGVYRRSTKKRLPIESVKLSIQSAEPILKETLEEKSIELYEHYLKQTLQHLSQK